MTVRQADFNRIKAEASFEAVLQALGLWDALELKKENEYGGVCPLQSHTGEKHKTSFYVNVTKRTFYCHGCKASGKVLEFVTQYRGEGIREAGIWIEDNVLNVSTLDASGDVAEASHGEIATVDPELFEAGVRFFTLLIQEAGKHADNPQGLAEKIMLRLFAS